MFGSAVAHASMLRSATFPACRTSQTSVAGALRRSGATMGSNTVSGWSRQWSRCRSCHTATRQHGIRRSRFVTSSRRPHSRQQIADFSSRRTSALELSPESYTSRDGGLLRSPRAHPLAPMQLCLNGRQQAIQCNNLNEP
jgi:hypothetical protein